MTYKSDTILITGLNSVIGWNTFQAARGQMSAIGTYRKKHPAFRGKQFARINLDDAGEVTAFIQKIQPKIVIHTRGICDLDVCETTPGLAQKVNVGGTRKLLDAVKTLAHFKKFVYVSTDHVFDGEKGNYSEEDTPAPKHVFGRTKVEAEALVKDSGLPYVIVRPGLVIGASVQGNVGPRDFLLARLKAGKPATYFSDEWRSPIEAEELARQVLLLATSDAAGLFHFAGPQKQNRYELAAQLSREAGISTERLMSKTRAEDAWSHIRPKDLTLTSHRT